MPPPRPLRFVAGRSLGGLARWLPAPGFDTLHAPDLSDRAAIAAAKSGRILVTRTRALRRRADIPRTIFAVAGRTLDQLPQVIRDVPIRPGDLALFSRCAACNRPLEPVSKADPTAELLFGRVPDFVWQTRERFSICPSCGRVFWSGGHRERARLLLEKLWPSTGAAAEPPGRR